MERRTFLSIIGLGTITTVAGCSTTSQNSKYENVEYTIDKKELTPENSDWMDSNDDPKTALKFTVIDFGDAYQLKVYIHKEDYTGETSPKEGMDYKGEWMAFGMLHSRSERKELGASKFPVENDWFLRGYDENNSPVGFETGQRLLITAIPTPEQRLEQDYKEEYVLEKVVL